MYSTLLLHPLNQMMHFTCSRDAPCEKRKVEKDMLNTVKFALCLFCSHFCYPLRPYLPWGPGNDAIGRCEETRRVGGAAPSLGLLSTSVFSPKGLVTTIDVSGVTKLYFSDNLKASFFVLSFSGPDNCSLCHKFCTYVSKMTKKIKV